MKDNIEDKTVKIGNVVYFYGPFNSKSLGFICDTLEDNKYKINLGFGSFCMCADLKSFEVVKSKKTLNLKINEIYFDTNRSKLVKVKLKTDSGFYLVEDLISKQEYITDCLEMYDLAKGNLRVIEWVKINKGKNGIINCGKHKNKEVKIYTVIEQYNSELQLSGFFVYTIPHDHKNSLIAVLPEQIDIKKEDY